MFSLQLKSHTIYLEEDVTKNVEFPEADGQFNLTREFGVLRYRVCGEQEPTAPKLTPLGPSSSSQDWDSTVRTANNNIPIKFSA